MTETRGTICYLTQEKRGEQIYIHIMDQENGKQHRFPVSVLNCSRLAYECAGFVNLELGEFTRPLS